jgi:leukotriene-A4 hydrolase
MYVVWLAFLTGFAYSGLWKFVLGAKHEVMGSALHIPLIPGTKAGSTAKVTIFYKTTKDSTALQWLAKE